MRICIYLLWSLLALPFHLSPVWADGVKRNDPDMWSSAFERSIAPHWLAAEKANDVVSDRQFIIVCDPDNLVSYIRSLKHLAELKEDYRKNRKNWDDGRNLQYPCISKNSYRLPRIFGNRVAQPSDADDPEAHGASYKVVKEDANSQIVELRFRDLNTGIYDSFFKYEVRDDEVIPLERWVVGRGLLAVFVTELILALLLVLAGFGIFRLFRVLRSRHANH